MRRPLRILALGAALLGGAAGMIGHAPVYLPALPAAAPPLPGAEARVFGYATLTNPLVRLVVVGRPVPAEPAALAQWRRTGRDLTPDPEAVTEGRVFTVSPEEMRRLDQYERAGARYSRSEMALTDGRTAWVYDLIAPRSGD